MKYQDVIPTGWRYSAAQVNNNYSYNLSKDLFLVTGFHVDTELTPGIERDFHSYEMLWIASGKDCNRTGAATYAGTYPALYEKYR